MSACEFLSCGKPVRARGLCNGHYQQRRLGKPLRPLDVRSTKDPVTRFWGLVEKTPECWLWTGADNGNGHGKFCDAGGHLVYAHRFSFELANGEIPTGLEVDHICRVRNCVRPDHLRLATHKENSENHGVTRRNTTGYRGVTYRKDTGQFQASVMHKGRQVSAGCYATAAEAAAAASDLRRSLFTHSIEEVHA